jgi:predicted O-methyltransferase YrrM
MRIIPKIKQLFFIYKLKIFIRQKKNFFYNVIYLIINRTPLKILIRFIKSNFFVKKNFEHNYYNNTKFSGSDWFTSNIYILNKFMKNKKSSINNILEIGSYEGRSAIFFINYFRNSKVTCVDTWLGSHEHNVIMKKVEDNFDNNIKIYKNKIIKCKNTSDNFFFTNKLFFDFIYIDGLHTYDQVNSDLENAYKFLKPKGYILIDDYLWKFYPINKNVINSANNFIQKYNQNLEVIYVSAQVLLKKIL